MTPPSAALLFQFVIRFVLMLIFIGGALFLSAGTLHYWQGWLYLAVSLCAMTILFTYFIQHDPALLERRFKGHREGETSIVQKTARLAMQLSFLGILVVSGLDHRFTWSHLPIPIVLAADFLVALSWMIFFFVFRENSFTSSVIEVDQEQRVVSTGPYRLVRHPLYSGAALYCLSTSLALGSLWTLLFGLIMVAALLLRLTDEERFLCLHLPGYTEYRTQTRSRLIPGIF
jgi:protein-S-isoprenylcysteine O-methyltransferase Ste14